MKKGYQDQLSILFNDFFAQSDSYSHYLRKIGYECKEVPANVEPLQKAWAKENGIQWNRKNFITWLPLEYARRFRPEIVWINDFNVFNSSWIKELKVLCPSIRFTVVWCSSPISSLERLRGYDLVLTSSPAMLNRFREHGLKCELLRHAFDPRILGQLDHTREKDIEFSFVGSLNVGDEFHNLRAELIGKLVKHFDLNLFCPNTQGNQLKVSMRHAVYHTVRILRLMRVPEEVIKRLPIIARGCFYEKSAICSHRDKLISLSKGAVYGMKMYEILHRSRLSLNVHVDMAGAFTGNMRLFEATGVGSCLLTDWKEDMPTLFQSDVEVMTYKSVDDCLEKARWLIDHPSLCREIAEAGQRRTLAEHTYAQRAEQLDHILTDNFKKI